MHARPVAQHITGRPFTNQREQRFDFMPGPIFDNVVLVEKLTSLHLVPKAVCWKDGRGPGEAVMRFTHELAGPSLLSPTQKTR